jgi:hypothetical protein
MVGDYQHIEDTYWVRLVCLDMVQLRGAFFATFPYVCMLEWNLLCYDPTTPVLATKEHAVIEKN